MTEAASTVGPQENTPETIRIVVTSMHLPRHEASVVLCEQLVDVHSRSSQEMTRARIVGYYPSEEGKKALCIVQYAVSGRQKTVTLDQLSEWNPHIRFEVTEEDPNQLAARIRALRADAAVTTPKTAVACRLRRLLDMFRGRNNKGADRK